MSYPNKVFVDTGTALGWLEDRLLERNLFISDVARAEIRASTSTVG